MTGVQTCALPICDETRCAKVYKEATNRSFRQAVDYTENRKVKNSRQARAMAKGTKFGREARSRFAADRDSPADHRFLERQDANAGGAQQETALSIRSTCNRGRTIAPMKSPKRLQSLIDEGLIDTVVRQLMSGKEAMVYVVRCGEETRCAKVYKEATQRSFRQAVDYTENRKVKNTRQARAMAKGTRFGREAQEAAWQSADRKSVV